MKKYNILLISILSLCAIELCSAQQTELIERLEHHVYLLAADSMQGRKSGSEQAQIAAKYIEGQFHGAGVEPAFEEGYLQSFEPDMLIGPSGRLCSNVVGIIRSENHALRNEYIVVGAHYDHMGIRGKGDHKILYNGADDNASGVAALIELGRALASDRASLGRSVILVAFDGAEFGLLGSSYFVNNPVVPIEDISLMLSIDMVGWLGDGSLGYYGTGSLKTGTRVLHSRLITPEGLRIQSRRFENSIGISTDTEPFSIQGIPTLHVTTGTGSPYHKDEDRAELLDYEGMEMVVGHLSGAVKLLSTDTELGSSGVRSYKHKNYDRRFEAGASIGVGTNWVRYSSGPSRSKTSLSLAAGGYAQFNMGWFAIRPELMFERSGSRYVDGKMWSNSVTVPLNLVFQSPKRYVGGFFLTAGGFYRYAFSGSYEAPGVDLYDLINRNEVGVQWGLGFWLYRVSIGVDFRYGLTGMLREPGDGPDIRNRTAQLKLQYRF